MNLEELQKKVKIKDKDAMHKLGKLYVYEKNNFEEGYKLLEEAGKSGHVDSVYEMGVIHSTDKFNVKNHKTAIAFFEQASRKKHSKASYQLGKYYFYGQIVKKDTTKADEFLRKAALSETNSIVEAQFLMGTIYENGLIDNLVDHAEAFRFYKIAADKDHLESQYKVGKYLIEGVEDHFEKDLEKGMDYLRKAAEKKNIQSMNILSAIYLDEAKRLLGFSSKKDTDAEYVLKSLLKIKTDIIYDKTDN